MNVSGLNENARFGNFSFDEVTSFLSSATKNIAASDTWNEAAVVAQKVCNWAYPHIAATAATVDQKIGHLLPSELSSTWTDVFPSSLKIAGGIFLLSRLKQKKITKTSKAVFLLYFLLIAKATMDLKKLGEK